MYENNVFLGVILGTLNKHLIKLMILAWVEFINLIPIYFTSFPLTVNRVHNLKRKKLLILSTITNYNFRNYLFQFWGLLATPLIYITKDVVDTFSTTD